MSESIENNKRIAKNTLFLYFRTLIILMVSLYTSRVILNALGVEDYGVYNVVGGVVSMFNVISGALSSAISRFITFELGKGKTEKLKVVFSTSVNIQFAISLLVILIGEIVGLWFLNYKMNIPPERLVAANWVLQCSLLTFCINLISVPYNASIIAHEKMNTFAYVSILEAFLKLAVCFLIIISPWDRLVFYAILLVCVSIIIRMTYTVYCHRHFEESHYHFVFDKRVMKEMTGFAGWNFFTNSAYVFNHQGVNLLVNLFFGVTVNAARGIAMQVEHAVVQLVNSFTTAIKPQITKSYAAGNKEEMIALVCRGAKFSYFLMFIFALPVLMEAEYILTIWLKIIPPHAVNFVRLSIIATMINVIGITGYTACMATGKIRKYVLCITPVTCLVFFLSWISFKLGAPSETPYILYALVYIGNEIIRLKMMKELLDFPILRFVKDVICVIVVVTLITPVVPLSITLYMEPSAIRLIITIFVCLATATTTVFLLGLTKNERHFVVDYLSAKLKR